MQMKVFWTVETGEKRKTESEAQCEGIVEETFLHCVKRASGFLLQVRVS